MNSIYKEKNRYESTGLRWFREAGSMRMRPLIKGILTFIPGFQNFLSKGTHGTNSARYCYSVWMRHLIMAHKNHLTSIPKIVAELGPGYSIGIGLAALLTGAERYLAFDIVEHADIQRNVKIFDELVGLFREQANIPGQREFPQIQPQLKSLEFPSNLFIGEYLKAILNESRVEKIKQSIYNVNNVGSMISYVVPYYDPSLVEKGTVDLIYSQSVMEHVDALDSTYKAMHDWLKPGGFMSQVVDFRSHNMSKKWNGQWACSDIVWFMIRGRRPYLINREPCSTHLRLIGENGFRIVNNIKVKTQSDVTRSELAQRFRNISDEDLTTSIAFIQAVKTVS